MNFLIVNKAEIDVFLELACFFHDPSDVGNLISGSSAFSKTSLNIRKFMVHILLKPGWGILSITLLAFEMTFPRCRSVAVAQECSGGTAWPRGATLGRRSGAVTKRN